MHERLKLFIHQKGWKKKVFAEKMGITAQSVNSYLNGSLDIQKLFVKLYENGCDLNWLVSGNRNYEIDIYEKDRLALTSYYQYYAAEIRERLKQLVIKYNIDINAIAAKLKVNPEYLTDMIKGEIVLTFEAVFAFSDYCKFSTAYIMNNIGDEHDDIAALNVKINSNSEANINKEEIYELKGQIKLLKEMLSESQAKSKTETITYKSIPKRKLAAEPKV